MSQYSKISKTWDNIETIEPDEIDLQMQHDIENDPDCKDFFVC